MNKKATDTTKQPKKTSQAEPEKETAQPQEGEQQANLKEAQNSLSKLPIMGPALWLYARDPLKKFMFMADIDWAVLPPVILDQCRLYTKEGIPYAFFTWALVNDDIDQRLRSGTLRIAPHEWQSGEHLWLVDVVIPFGNTDEMIAELRKTQFPGRKISALMPDPQQGNQLRLREWEADK